MHDRTSSKVCETPIVASGGWDKSERRMGRPKAMLFLMLSVLWLFPSFGAVWLIEPDFMRWIDAPNLLAALGMVKFEQWIAFSLLGGQCLFGWLAWHYRRNEPLQEIVTGDEPNPDPDPKKLH